MSDNTEVLDIDSIANRMHTATIFGIQICHLPGHLQKRIVRVARALQGEDIVFVSTSTGASFGDSMKFSRKKDKPIWCPFRVLTKLDDDLREEIMEVLYILRWLSHGVHSYPRYIGKEPPRICCYCRREGTFEKIHFGDMTRLRCTNRNCPSHEKWEKIFPERYADHLPSHVRRLVERARQGVK